MCRFCLCRICVEKLWELSSVGGAKIHHFSNAITDEEGQSFRHGDRLLSGSRQQIRYRWPVHPPWNRKPCWMAVEAWDFGTLSWLLEMAHPNVRAAIAKRYGLPPNTLVSWIKTLAFVRNTSAHHARLWNAGIINQPLVPKPFEARQLVHIGSNLERRTRR